jgi:hypothetical protein
MTSISRFRLSVTLSVTDAAGQVQTVEAPSVVEAVVALARRCRLPEDPRWTLSAEGEAQSVSPRPTVATRAALATPGRCFLFG